MRKYVQIDEKMRCTTKAIDHPIPEADRLALLLDYSYTEEQAEEISRAVNAAFLGFARIVETDNFGGDYPDESFLIFPMPKAQAESIADAINASNHENCRRFWKVVSVDYKLQPGFEP